MNFLIRSACQKPLISNLIFVGTLLGAVLLWSRVGKEEMPDFAMDSLRARVVYPGASAEDVEALVTRLLEEQLKGLSGLGEVRSTSSFGSVTFQITLEGQGEDTRDTIQQIKDAFDRADLPLEVEEPTFSRFTSAEKAIIDIGFYHRGAELLGTKEREELQKYVLAFESRLLSLPEISGAEKNGYVKPELQIVIQPEKLRRFDISLSQVRQKLISHHIRVPAGALEDAEESEFTVVSQLDNIDSLKNLIVRGGFEGNKLRLDQIAEVRWGFAKYKTISKIQGHEGIILNVKKSANTDILTANRQVLDFTSKFEKSYPDSPVGIILLDDESFDVRNRLSIIGWNGLIGFILIIIVLFIFLDFTSGVWVAMGIPFTLAFTLIGVLLIGYTINNMTLAALIIVLGIVVDDAIIIAENISRRKSLGESGISGVVSATNSMIGPVLASILTTCVAFVPLYFFSGRFGLFVKYIPAIVFLMLGASLLESIFILPGHMLHRIKLPFASRKVLSSDQSHWMFKVEKFYSTVLLRVLKGRFFVLVFFFGVLSWAFYLFNHSMKFVMFPREESTQIAVRVIAPEETTRTEMAQKIRLLEDLFLADKEIVTSVRSQVAQSRRGGPVRDNEAFIRVEITPPSERDVSLKTLLQKWEASAEKIQGFTEIRFLKSRFGSDSGSPIQIEIQENDDEVRREITQALFEIMQKEESLQNVEIERPVTRNEFRAVVDQEESIRLGVDPKTLATSLRAYLEGEVLYHFIKGDEEIDARLTSDAEKKMKIEDVLSLTAANERNYLVPFSNLLTVEQGRKPSNVQRVNFKRTTEIFADLKDAKKTTPLEVAEDLETRVFPQVLRSFPSAHLTFRGEVEDSRESKGDFLLALALVIGLIYFLLAALFNSLGVPLLIASVIPFGAVGVILAFAGHGMMQFGFFAVIGTLGMIGVVVNDAIVMVSQLEENVDLKSETWLESIASHSSTRLRAVIVTTLTTVAGMLPTAYGIAGYDSMLAEMMLAMAWGLIFGTLVTLVFVPCVYAFYCNIRRRIGVR